MTSPVLPTQHQHQQPRGPGLQIQSPSHEPLNQNGQRDTLWNCQRGIILLSVPSKIFNRVILNCLQEAMDKRLQDQQAGFRKDRSCTDHIATLRIIIELSMEWNMSLYIYFMDFEKVFDSLGRTSLWRLINDDGIPTKITNRIKTSYEGTSCKVIHAGQLSRSFKVRIPLTYKFWGESGVGLGIPSGNLPQKSPNKPWNETHREQESEDDAGIAGGTMPWSKWPGVGSSGGI